jgi:hypothetical protein
LIIYKLDPGLIVQAKNIQEEVLRQRGLSDDQIDAALSISAKMMTPAVMAFSALFVSVIIGTIVSLLTSIFIKKEPNADSFDEAMEDIKTEE